jgi:FAD/FMN-containing dehydrogenase
LGGTVSAEHGIGKLKKDYLRVLYPPDVLEEMMAIKSSLDPGHILNPGNVI